MDIHFQIGSHPNIYVLDTPGILPPTIPDAEVCSKLALTGMFIQNTTNLIYEMKGSFGILVKQVIYLGFKQLGSYA